MLAFYILLSVLVSFICSMLEAVILSVTPSFLTSLRDKDAKLYKKISYLKEDIEKPLASILTFNTIAHTIGAAGAGAEAQKLWGNEYLAAFSAILTFIILFFSEIIPKSIGAKSWKSLLPISYYILKPMIVLSLPVVWISTKLSKLIKGDGGVDISRDEIPALAELGLQAGVIQKDEYQSLKAVINFSKVKIGDLITPVEKVEGFLYSKHIPEAYEDLSRHTFSRLIVFGVTKDDVKGFVMRKDILQAHINNKTDRVIDYMKNILILPDKISARELFRRLLKMKVHIAAVIDDNGSFLGIVTLEDLIENALGHDIYDEFDVVEPSN
jgi:CBS domain containing-hemolysin-like protein